MRAGFAAFLRQVRRRPVPVLAVAVATSAAAVTTTAFAHGTHPHSHDGSPGLQARIRQLERQVSDLSELVNVFTQDVSATTGQGKAIFSWDRGLTDCFPEDARPFEKDLHGGFNEDPKTGIVYTGVPGYGLCRISPDLKTWTRFGDDPRLKGNIHGIVVFEHVDGRTLIAVAQNDDQRVLIIDPNNGDVLQQLSSPRGGEFNFAEANKYYSNRPVQQAPWGRDGVDKSHVPDFACTDVTYLDGRLYVVTGYCDGDFVLTATAVEDSQNGELFRWGPTAWGGKGDGAGQFRTAHGVFAHDGNIFVANREGHEV